ncbi:MAG TPA: peptide chain release factor N(5)-glutamine methyltransferase [Bacteroidota bacterium]|nr:peptide chain release factor N(5)-glutamine methyltransferase [Bacteroidota bacterium]
MNQPAGLITPPSTILPALRWAEDVLRKGRIDEARLTAELLMCHLLGCERIRLYVEFEKILRGDEVDAFVGLIRRRLSHEPLQYITGETDFMGIRINVDRRVLIPRPETEVLTEEMLGYCRGRGPSPLRILDVGVGSGNIAVALAHYHPPADIVGVDISQDALDVAGSNIRRHNLEGRISLLRADVLRDELPFREGRFDAIVSNPPYIPSAEMAGLDPEIRLFEPAIATTDGGDGLSFFRRLAVIATSLLAEGGVLMVETAYNQARGVERIFLGRSLRDTGVARDLSGIERVVSGKK